MFRPRVSENKIQLYNIYVQRMMHEGELFWNRFKIYLGFNTGLMAVFGFLLQSDVADFLNIESNFSFIITFIGGLGIMLSIAWLLVNLNGNMWMSLIKSIIINIEDGIFQDENYALYHRIKKRYEEKLRYKFDVVIISIGISLFFLFMWIALFALALFFMMNHPITTYSV